MLKLHQIYFKKLFLLIIALFLIVGSIVYFWIKDFYFLQAKQSLKNDANLISLMVKKNSNFNMLVKKINNNNHISVQFIDENGKKYGIETSSKNSKNSKKDLLSIVKKVKVGNHFIYIIVTKKNQKFYKYIIYLGIKIIVITFIFFVLMFFIIYKIGKNIEKEVNKISSFLIYLTKKRKKIQIDSSFSKEFYNITQLLTKIASILTKQDKKRLKYVNNLKKINKQKDDIISAISHEFKNPITIINGYSKTLLEDDDINKDIEKRFLQKIYLNGERLTNLIDTLRLSVRLDDDNLKLNLSKFELFELVKEIVENILLTYPDRKINIDKKENVFIKADRILLGVAISNLIENALKYSHDDIKIIINKDKLTIKDQGIGIEEKEIKNITKKFYRVSKNSWNNSLGLGLNIVINILFAHHFKLEIQSQKNIGSSFSINFLTK